MEFILICFFIVTNIYEVIEFLKPFFKWKYLKDGYKLKLISPIWYYFMLCIELLGAVCCLFLFISNKEFNNIIILNISFYTGIVGLSKSYVILCKNGLFLNGTYFSYEEKQEGQYVTKIIFWNRRIYAIKTINKYAYVFLRKKYINELTNERIIY